MAFFKFRKGTDDVASTPVPPQSVEVIRQRAKHRLVGATVLVLLGVIGLPLLFDKQPRPIPVDTPIDIPDKNKVAPLVIPSSPAAPEAAVALNKPLAKASAATESVIITESAETPKSALVPAKKQAPVLVETAKEATKIVVNESAKPSKASASAVLPKATEAGRAQAILDGAGLDAKSAHANASDKADSASQASGDERFVVQVGAFADAARAHEVRMKIERAGLKTYTHVAETKDGKRIRVRIGPFASRADADKTAEKIKKLGLPAALLTL